jgi:hypothetical protein
MTLSSLLFVVFPARWHRMAGYRCSDAAIMAAAKRLNMEIAVVAEGVFR